MMEYRKPSVVQKCNGHELIYDGMFYYTKVNGKNIVVDHNQLIKNELKNSIQNNVKKGI